MAKLGIPWRNVYYMLCYAIDELVYFSRGSAGTEDCSGVVELLANIFIRAYEEVEARNTLKEYKGVETAGEHPVGRFDLEKSLSTGEYGRGILVYEYQHLDADNESNRYIKLAIKTLMYAKNEIPKDKVIKLHGYLLDMEDIQDTEYSELESHELDILELPDWYRPVMVASKLILENMLVKDKKYNEQLLKLNDERRLAYIFEKFVRNVYSKEYKRAKSIGRTYRSNKSTYTMDTVLRSGDKVVELDTKWYTTTNAKQAHVGNKGQASIYKRLLGQLDVGEDNIKAVILYAKGIDTPKSCDENFSLIEEKPDMISTRDIDLNQDMNRIKQDLFELADGMLS